MDIQLDGSNLKLNNGYIDKEKLNEVVDMVSTGNAILFTGAGFTWKSKNILNKQPPDGKKLSCQICDLARIDHDEDLKYVSDYYCDNFGKEKLINLLRDNFTIKEVREHHKIICSQKWKRIYTTNYDNLLCVAGSKIGKSFIPVTIDESPSEYLKLQNVCVHLNGNIGTLNEDSLEDSFKLSNSSYCSSNSFINSSWNYILRKDLEKCSAIVFIGYSMYDIDIQKILHGCEEFHKKSYFIIKGNPTTKESFQLSKFGTVIPVGINKFAKILDKVKTQQPQEKEFYLESFEEYKSNNIDRKITDESITNFLMYGSLEDDYFISASTGIQRLPFIINRNVADSVVKMLLDSKNVLLHSGLGNGKSVLTKIIASNLINRGRICYFMTDEYGAYEEDLEKLGKTENKITLIIDGYSANNDFFKYFNLLKYKNINLLLTSRTSEIEWYYNNDLQKMSINELNINQLEEEEIEFFVKIIDNVALWGDKSLLPEIKKNNEIKNRYKKQISLTLLNLFNSPQIKDRCKRLIEPLFKNAELKKTLFIIALLDVWGISVKRELVSDIAKSDIIYSSDFSSNSLLRELFPNKNGALNLKSPLFASFLLKNFFKSTYVINQLLDIASDLDKKHRVGEQDKLFKNILRFSTIEELLEQNKKNSLVKHYEELKTRVPWLKKDSHYWLQYGMARITFKEYLTVQRYLDYSYEIAMRKPDYDTSYIDTQQARVYMLIAIESNNTKEAIILFKKASKLLDSIDVSKHTLRQIKYYSEIHDKYYAKSSKNQRERINGICKSMKMKIEKTMNGHNSNYYNIELYCKRIIEMLEHSIENSKKLTELS